MKHKIQLFGLLIFVLSLGTFIASLGLADYKASASIMEETLDDSTRAELVHAVADDFYGTTYTSKFAFFDGLTETLNKANDKVIADRGITDEELQSLVAEMADLTYDTTKIDPALSNDAKEKLLKDNTGWMMGKSYGSEQEMLDQLKKEREKIHNQLKGNYGFDMGKIKSLKKDVTKASTTGFLTDNLNLLLLISFGFTCLGGLIYIIPMFWQGQPGIKHDNIWFSAATNRGWIGIGVAVLLIAFYILLYWFPYLITEWLVMLDPVAQTLKGADADQWFMYGLMYCLVMLVMGIRMYAKYRGNNYQLVRTTSVLFFQIGFAFMIPNIMELMNYEYYVARDFKNIWPLDYSFFFDYNLKGLLKQGLLGYWIIGWSVALIIIVVPIMTFFYGKRWYCSWVCGCGGLAETLGDPYRQLSDKTVSAWKVERWLIHFVLFFVTAMTIAVIYTFINDNGSGIFTTTNFLIVVSVLFGIVIGVLLGFRKKWTGMSNKVLYLITGAMGLLLAIVWTNHLTGNTNVLFLDSYTVRGWYGFLIGAAFAGIVGTGFYPVMGNRMWCRFGCPLAGYFGIIQRLRSRFRITTNGGQCISCGNCSTYCEMGIDVRWYAQRGQNIVRSSCVGCGVCSAVCPRGVLKLENGPDNDMRINENPIIIGNDGISLNPNATDDTHRE